MHFILVVPFTPFSHKNIYSIPHCDISTSIYGSYDSPWGLASPIQRRNQYIWVYIDVPLSGQRRNQYIWVYIDVPLSGFFYPYLAVPEQVLKPHRMPAGLPHCLLT